jgi:hypothetical protein
MQRRIKREQSEFGAGASNMKPRLVRLVGYGSFETLPYQRFR